MDKNRVSGKARQVKGAVEGAAGRATGNIGQQVRGKVDKAVGKGQSMVGRAKDEVRAEVTRQNERRPAR